MHDDRRGGASRNLLRLRVSALPAGGVVRTRRPKCRGRLGVIRAEAGAGRDARPEGRVPDARPAEFRMHAGRALG